MRINLFLFFLLILLQQTKESNDYVITSINYSESKTRLTAKIKYNKEKFRFKEYSISPKNNKTNIKLIRNLILDIKLECDGIIHFQIYDEDNNRFRPNLTDEAFINYTKKCKHNLDLNDFGLQISKPNKPFYFSLELNSKKIFSLNPKRFLFTDTLINFEILLTSNDIFGFGERNSEFRLATGKYTIWPNDTTYTYRDKRKGGYNLMGHQPIGLHKTINNIFLGLIFENTNAQDFLINSYWFSNFPYSIEHRTIGGIINYYITFGNTPDEAISNIHQIIGRPTIPPFWSFGWHQCRWGYGSTYNLKEVNNKYDYLQIPLDALWTDVDMMENSRNFHLAYSYSDMPKFIEELHNIGRKFIPLVDYAIPKTNEDKYYVMGVNNNAFIMSNYTKSILETAVWPGRSAFPDFFTKSGVDLWFTGLNDYYNLLNYDGMWIDMNEPALLYVLEYGAAEYASTKLLMNIDLNIYSNLPYIPGYRSGHYDIQSKGISVNAYSHENDPKNNYYTMYNVRPLISKKQVKITNDFLRSVKKRPFIVSRANTIGHGKYGFHWLGDNVSTFEDLYYSIAGIFNYNIFGIPMTGADICGFHEDSTDELCARWHNLGALYPFSRNHNEIYKKSQEPFAFFENGVKKKTLNAATNSIRFKYSIIRYIYSQMMLISIGEKGSYFKPAFFEFINDDVLYQSYYMNRYIMAGSCLYYIPNLQKNQWKFNGYFPNWNFNKFPSGEKVFTYDSLRKKGYYLKLEGSYEILHIFIKGGSIIPYQNVIYPYNVKTTNDLRTRNIDLIINPDHFNKASGDVFYDNDQFEILENQDYTHVKIFFSGNSINFNNVNLAKTIYNENYIDNIIENIRILRSQNVFAQINHKVSIAEVFENNGNFSIYNITNNEKKDEIVIEKLFIKIEELKYINLR